MKRFTLVLASLGLAMAAHAHAQSPQVDEEDTKGRTAIQQAEEDVPAQADRSLNDRNCLTATGSRLIRADRQGRKCAPVGGRAYDREDLDSTGAVDLADALRRLDPAIR